MTEDLLPLGVVFAESWGDEPSALLFGEELDQIDNAVESRKREFATARSLARQALGGLGLQQAPILRGAKGDPLWPPGVVGSITHCTGYRAAAVARGTHLQALGIDAEIDDALPPEVIRSILVPEELSWIESASSRRHWDRVFFSAKESVYKAWFPLMHCWLDFTQVAVTVDPVAGEFRVRSVGSLPEGGAEVLELLCGRIHFCDGIVLTAVFLPRKSLSHRQSGLSPGVRRAQPRMNLAPGVPACGSRDLDNGVAALRAGLFPRQWVEPVEHDRNCDD